MDNLIPMGQSIELINLTPVNPLISKCLIKVCYVSDQPNRNRSIISKETGIKLANSIPGSPIVGFYNETSEDFEGHNRVMEIKNGEFSIKDTTRPYGFVDLNAKVWFQKELDRNGVEREYMVTEGYLWTGQYPECQRALEYNNPQSMELDEKTVDGNWTRGKKGEPEFFIINDAIMSKLCILGEDVEPCFEGAGFCNFSLDQETYDNWCSFMYQMKEILNGGGKPMLNKYSVNIGDALWTALYDYAVANENIIVGAYESEEKTFAVLSSKDQDVFYRLDFSFENDVLSFGETTEDITSTFSVEDAQFTAEDTLTFKKKEEKKEEDKEEKEENSKEEPKEGEPKNDDKKEPVEEDEEEDDEPKKKKKKEEKYSLEEIPEYVSLLAEHEQLKTDYAALQSENATLTQFKTEVERKQKMNMINVDFCMLDESLKKDVIDNVDKYSLDEIEAKLSIICVRNKVNFNLDNDNKEGPTTYNLEDAGASDAGVPAWVLAAREVAKTIND